MDNLHLVSNLGTLGRCRGWRQEHESDGENHQDGDKDSLKTSHIDNV